MPVKECEKSVGIDVRKGSETTRGVTSDHIVSIVLLIYSATYVRAVAIGH